jgi:hypothetical protein
MNRNLLKEAIADAKTVQETAIENAKAALEEAFAPFLREKLAAKLSEMEMEDDNEDDKWNAPSPDDDYEDDYEGDDYEEDDLRIPDDMPSYKTKYRYSDDEEDLLDLDALIRELEGEEMSEEEELYEAEDSEEKDKPKKDEPKKDKPKKDKSEDDEEEFDIEEMTEEELKSYIEEVVQDMVSSGELEMNGMDDLGDEGMEGEVDFDASVEAGEDMIDGNMMGGISNDEEVDIEIEDELDELMYEIKKSRTNKSHNETQTALNEAYKTIKTLSNSLKEINLLNAKLLYTNKIFKANTLNESQKIKVLGSLDKATNKTEAKLIYESLIVNINNSKKPIKESLGRASKVISQPILNKKQPIIEANEVFSRMQKIAGIIND